MQYENISFFVSSTFIDMHYERDALHLEVMPRILPIAEKELCSVQLFDLRWGVDTSDLSEMESSEKVLRVCLNGIDRCHPFMIIILGDRYGWIPDTSNISDAMNEHGISEEFYNKSVTELEILYGLILNSNTDCYIYLREINYDQLDPSLTSIYRDNDPVHIEKLKLLKERLRTAYPDRVRNYQPTIDSESGQIVDSGNFADLVTTDIMNVLSLNDNSVNIDWQERELHSITRRMNTDNSDLVYRSSQIRRVLNALSENPLVVLRGTAGSGKTSLLGQLLETLKQDNMLVIPFLCGNSSYSSDLIGMLRYIAYTLENDLGIEHNLTPGESNQSAIDRWQTHLTELCHKSTKPILFLINAYNQLPQSEETSRLLWAPEGLGSAWKCIISALPDTEILRDHADVQLSILTEEERVLILNRQFQKHGKSLDNSVIQHIIKRSSSSNPLYLRLVLARLLMLYRTDFEQINRDSAELGSSMASINHYLTEVISSLPENVDELGLLILNHAAELAAKVVKGSRESLSKSLEFLSVSRYGLRLCDLETAVESTGTKWNALQFEWMRYFLDFCFTEQADGRINFSYNSLRDGILKANKSDINKNHSIIAKTLSQSTTDTSASDAFYHLFSWGADSAPSAEKLFMRTVDHANNTMAGAFRQSMYEFADIDEGRTFIDIFNNLSLTGKWYASVLVSQFADDIPESPTRLKMLMDTSLLCFNYLSNCPPMDELINSINTDISAGTYLRQWEDEAGFNLENSMLRTMLLTIAANAAEPLLGTDAAFKLYADATEEADRAYSLRKQEKRLYIAVNTPAIYVAYIKMADLCLRLEKINEGMDVCVRGIKALYSLSSQSLFSSESFDAPVTILQSLMANLSSANNSNSGDLLERAYNYAELNYQIHSSSESLNSLFYSETSYADYLYKSGEKIKALELFSNALNHINTLSSKYYSISTLLNKCATELTISRFFLDDNRSLSTHYAEIAKKTALEIIQLAPEDPRPRILLARAKTNLSALLLINSLQMQAADMLYQMLDELEPWLEVPCDRMFTEQKSEIMNICSSLLEILDEPDTAALCLEYEKLFNT